MSIQRDRLYRPAIPVYLGGYPKGWQCIREVVVAEKLVLGHHEHWLGKCPGNSWPLQLSYFLVAPKRHLGELLEM